jgi:hypothetical protein
MNEMNSIVSREKEMWISLCSNHVTKRVAFLCEKIYTIIRLRVRTKDNEVKNYGNRTYIHHHTTAGAAYAAAGQYHSTRAARSTDSPAAGTNASPTNANQHRRSQSQQRNRPRANQSAGGQRYRQ